MKRLNLLSIFLIGSLICLSASSLTSFPEPFDDEGLYAGFSKNFSLTGNFNYPDYNTAPPFDTGNALVSPVITGLYGFLGPHFGFTLQNARVVSFILVWIAALFWFFICKLIGFNPWLGTLLFVSTERIFYASHVFRPEGSLVLGNVVLIFLLTAAFKKGLNLPRAFILGLFNAFLVLAHGNGITSALLTSYVVVQNLFKRKFKATLSTLIYIIGSLGGIGIFYLAQLKSNGGFAAFRSQSMPIEQYRKTLLEILKLDITDRWGRELIIVGGSNSAKLLRILFYLICFATIIYSLSRKKRSIESKESFSDGIAHQAAQWALFIILAYMFVVWDKIDIHIAEMMPFFLFSFITWYEAHRTTTKAKFSLNNISLVILLIINLMLTVHHAIAYRPPTLTDKMVNELSVYVSTQTKIPSKDIKYYVGKMNIWFGIHDRLHVISHRFAWQHFPLSGGVIVGVDSEGLEQLKKCQLLEKTPLPWFSLYRCP